MIECKAVNGDLWWAFPHGEASIEEMITVAFRLGAEFNTAKKRECAVVEMRNFVNDKRVPIFRDVGVGERFQNGEPYPAIIGSVPLQDPAIENIPDVIDWFTDQFNNWAETIYDHCGV